MNKDLKKYISFFLLLVLSILIAPKDLIHDMHHHDTIDVHSHNNSDVNIGEQHHHCLVLQLSFPEYYKSIEFFKIFLNRGGNTLWLGTVERIFSRSVQQHFLRGPPQA